MGSSLQTLYDFCLYNKDKRYLLDEWDYTKNNIKPNEITIGSGKKIWWVCKNGHSFSMAVGDRKNGSNCPYCSGRRAIKGQTDLCTTHPELIKEWDFSKNNIRPDDISYGSRKEVWWKCQNGHSYCMPIVRRAYGNNCPYCSNQKVLKGYNDLATVFPNVLKEWDYMKNNIKPDEIIAKSGKKVWWVCKNGHSYEQVVYSHIVEKANCPYCSGNKVLTGFNDLATTHPYLLKDWDWKKNSIKPTEISKGSSVKVWWKCNRGHSFQQSVYYRTSVNQGCPICNRELKTSFPEQALYYYISKCFSSAISRDFSILKNKNYEIDIYIPELKIGIEYDGYVWHKNTISRDNDKNLFCKNMGITIIRVRESGLPLLNNCINISRTDNYSDESLEVIIKKVLLKIGINVDVNIKQDRQNIYSAFVESEKENSIAVKFPEIAKEWHPKKNGKLTPYNVSCGSNKIIWWKCEKGHEYQKAVNVMINNKIGCPYCLGTKVLKGFNDLKSSYPELMKDWDYNKNKIKPEDIYKHSSEMVWWKCHKCGNSWKTQINTRTVGGHRCGVCSGRKIMKNLNDLSTTHPEILKEWDYSKNTIKPTQLSYSSKEKVWWVCSNGHSYCTDIATRTSGSGCPYCANKKVLKGFNDLLSVRPDLAAEWNYEKNNISPEEVVSGSGKSFWWKCAYGHEWSATLNNRITKNSGCPTCMKNKLYKKVINLDTNEIFESIKAASKSVGLSDSSGILKCCRGKIKTSGGYHWAYYEEKE